MIIMITSRFLRSPLSIYSPTSETIIVIFGKILLQLIFYVNFRKILSIVQREHDELIED